MCDHAEDGHGGECRLDVQGVAALRGDESEEGEGDRRGEYAQRVGLLHKVSLIGKFGLPRTEPTAGVVVHHDPPDPGGHPQLFLTQLACDVRQAVL